MILNPCFFPTFPINNQWIKKVIFRGKNQDNKIFRAEQQPHFRTPTKPYGISIWVRKRRRVMPILKAMRNELKVPLCKETGFPHSLRKGESLHSPFIPVWWCTEQNVLLYVANLPVCQNLGDPIKVELRKKRKKVTLNTFENKQTKEIENKCIGQLSQEVKK